MPLLMRVDLAMNFLPSQSSEASYWRRRAAGTLETFETLHFDFGLPLDP